MQVLENATSLKGKPYHLPNYIFLVFCAMRQKSIIQCTQKILQIISLSKFHFRTSGSTYKSYINSEKNPNKLKESNISWLWRMSLWNCRSERARHLLLTALCTGTKAFLPTWHKASGGMLLDQSSSVFQLQLKF